MVVATSAEGERMPLFGRRKVAERPVPPPDWNNIAEHLKESEQRVAACSGWKVGDGVDHPCAVYLTDAHMYVDVRPDASLVGSETITIPLGKILRIAVRKGPSGTPRLAAMWLPTGLFDMEDARMVAVDLRGDGIEQFAQHIARVEQTLS